MLMFKAKALTPGRKPEMIDTVHLRNFSIIEH